MEVTSLEVLEALMTEFFAPGTSNSRKHQIEKVLEDFGRRPDAWKNCLLCIAGTSNPYVTMFCMTSLESVINRRWLGLTPEARAEIRGSVYALCLDRRPLAPYLRNKAVKLVVDIARLSWPQFYPDFYSNVLTLVQSSDSTLLGLQFLLTAAEELVAPREDLSCARRTELRQLLLREVPATLVVLTGILRSVLESNKANATATPPPSPEQPRSQRRPGGGPAQLFSPAADASVLLSCMLSSDAAEKNPFCLVAPLDGETTQVVALTLKCLCQLFSWVPLSTVMTPELITAVFHFASLGCARDGDETDPDLDTSSFCRGAGEPLGVMALRCVNEIISKNCVPPDFEAFLLQLFKHTFHLLQRLLEEDSKTTNKLAEVDPDYLSGLTEFLRLFVTLHLHRLEAAPQFPVLDLLALLFRYTFLQPTLETYYSCLEIWAAFLDHLTAKCQLKTENRHAVEAKYHEAVMSLAGQSLHRTQFRRHRAELEGLDDDRQDPDGVTEWGELLRMTADILERVAALYPGDVRALLLTGWRETLEPYVTLPSLCEAGPGGRRLRLPGGGTAHELEALHGSLRDLATHQYLLGRLAPLFSEQGPDAGPLVHELVSAAAFGSSQLLHEVELPPGALRPTLIDVHAQSLATLRPWCHWMVAAQAGRVTTAVQVDALVAEMTVAVCDVIQSRSPERLVRAAVTTLVTITGTVRSGALVDCPHIQRLYGRAGQMQLQKQDRVLLYRALANLLLLPWLRAGDQLWDQRRRHLSVFLDSLTAEFRRLPRTPGLADSAELQNRAKPVIEQTLSTLSEIVSNILGEVTKTKQLCYECLQETIRDSLWVFGVFATQSDVCQEVLSFFLAAFESLRAQMGSQFTEQCVQVFLEVFGREDLARNMLEEGSAGCAALEKFLRLLRLIVSEPSAAFRRLLPAVLELVLDRLYPLLAQRPAPDLKVPLFELLAAVLEHNWRHFFRSSVLKTLSPGAEEEVANEKQFLAMLEAMGQSFLQPDINVFRLNLETLQMLNTKWKLYHKPVFRRLLLARFLTVLIQTLLHRSHDLLRDDIASTVHSLAAVDLRGFCEHFVPALLRDTPGLDEQQRGTLAELLAEEEDVPTFCADLQRFVSDLRYYRLVNESMVG
ncbi:exportin-6-like isoform X1 [Amphibalanus amphitrite]|nr:exportin-6-like isoform X1 [Amphibalanus amphitrite]